MADILARLDELVPDELIGGSKTMKSASQPTGTSKAQSIRTTTTGSTRDDELQSMLSEFDLLAQVQADTGEQGSESGSTIKFHRCPICHHADDFVLYTDTRTWSCFSASNETGISGGTALDYLQATGRAHDATSAVKLLREATNHPYEGKPDRGEALSWDDEESKTDDENQRPKLLLPVWQSVRASSPPKRSPCLVHAVLRRGHIGLFSGKGKIGKSWLGMQLCVAVAAGVPWLGFDVERGNVLMLDPELDPRSLDQRFHKVCAAMGVGATKADERITRWSLRGVRKADGAAPTFDDVAHDLRELRSFDMLPRLDLVFVDSMAALMTGDENSSRDVRSNFNTLLEVAELTGASVVCSHHQGKAQSGDRDAADRARGSSAFVDCPDVVLSLDEVYPPDGKPGDFLPEGARALCLTCAGIREFAPFGDVRLIYEYPLHRLDADGITSDWKPRSGQRDGGGKTAELNKARAETKAAVAQAAILAHLYHEGIEDPEGLTTTEAAKVAADALGKDSLPTKTLRAWLDGSPWLTVWKKSARKHYVCPVHMAPRAEGAPPEGEADITLLDLEIPD